MCMARYLNNIVKEVQHPNLFTVVITEADPITNTMHRTNILASEIIFLLKADELFYSHDTLASVLTKLEG